MSHYAPTDVNDGEKVATHCITCGGEAQEFYFLCTPCEKKVIREAIEYLDEQDAQIKTQHCPICEANGQASKGAWSSEVPTEPGFYWRRCIAPDVMPIPRVVEVEREIFGDERLVTFQGFLEDKPYFEWYSVQITPPEVEQ